MAMYKKRLGTSGIRGQLYETKLLSLLYLRALHDNTIEEFQIAANVEKMGQFDDIIFKVKVKGYDKPVAMFIQAMHAEPRVDKKQALQSDLSAYFKSYLKIRQMFDPSNKDSFFSGRFEETECLFVIYTNATIGLTTTSEALVGGGILAKPKYLIGTGGTVSHLYNQEEHVKSLCEVPIKEEIIHLAKRLAQCISHDLNFEMLLSDEIVLRYHVILAQRVVDVSDKQTGGHRIASFRHDFFDINEKYLTIFKYALIKEFGKKRKIDPTDLEKLVSEFLTEPTDIVKLSKLIGSAVTYNNGQLILETSNEQITKKYEPSINQMFVSQSTMKKAVDLAAREILSYLHFKVPAAFGNKDLTIRGSDVKVEKRINYLVEKIRGLLINYKLINMDPIVTIDDSLDKGFLQLNGGIAGAIGNIFVLDDDPKLMKITDNSEQLGPLAKRLYSKLNEVIPNLLDYKFCFKVNAFPKLSFEYNDYDKNLAKDFLNRLIFYSNQADETKVEQTLKEEIGYYQYDQSNYFQTKTDAIFLRYHDDIQKWWEQSKEACYLTRENDIFQQSMNSIIKDPLMSALHESYMIKIKQYNYTFTDAAVYSLNLQDHSTTIITAENITLTVIKVMQHLKNKEHVVLDFNYITNLPTIDRYTLRSELIQNYDKVVILICNDIQKCEDNKQQEKKDIIEIVTVRQKNTIIVTNRTSVEILKNYFPKADNILHDKKLCLSDLSEESQMRILKTATAKIPGVEIRLEHFLRGWPMPCSGSAGGAAAAPAADSKTGTGSQRIGDEEQSVPGSSRDPL